MSEYSQYLWLLIVLALIVLIVGMLTVAGRTVWRFLTAQIDRMQAQAKQDREEAGKVLTSIAISLDKIAGRLEMIDVAMREKGVKE